MCGRIRQQRLEQRRLALAVAAHQANLFAARHRGAESVDDHMVAIRLANVFYLQNVLARRTQLIEANVGALNVRPRQLAGLQPLHFLSCARSPGWIACRQKSAR